MRAWSTCTFFILSAALFAEARAWAQPLPAADDGTRSKPAPKAPVDPDDADAPVAPPAGSSSPNKPSAEPSDEADVDDVSDGPDPSRAPPAGKGAVWGVVKSKGSDDTILEAIVSVIGRKEYSTTDVDGRYRLELPPGTYQVRVVYELHKPARIRNVVVQRGKVAKIDVTLQPDDTAVEEVTAIEAEAERASAATQLMLRKNAAQASDSIGAQDIAKTPDRNAAEAVKRVVGTTVVDGKYIFVRGLGDRYTNSMLNGSPLPSPEPDRQAVPLDMFPTLVLSDLTISKTFVPDMPGDFAGGSLNIHTRDLPNKFLFQVTGGLGANTLSTFGNRLSYKGGGTDWLGMDDGSRKVPNEVPGSRLVSIDPNTGQRFDLTQVGRAINRDMGVSRDFNLPHGTVSAVVGDSFKLGGQRVLGYVVGATYSRRFQKRTDEILRRFDPNPTNPGELVMRNDYRAETGTDTVTWSGLGTVSYAFDNDHKVAVTGLYSRNAEKEARSVSGRNDEGLIKDERLRFINRALMYGQVRGEHRFRKLDTAVLTWSLLQSRATLNDPALRQTAYDGDPSSGQFTYIGNSPTAGQNFFAAQGETTRGVVLDWLQPLAKHDGAPKLKAGAMLTLRGRSFQARRFRFQRNNSTDRNLFFQPPGQLFTDANVGSLDGGAPLEVEEWTRPTDSYAARYDVYAGYVMTDLPITSRLRFVAGPRLESSIQTVDSYDPFSGSTERVQSRLSRTDILPSANAIVKVTKDSNIRLSATRTVARPQLRELAPFIFTEYLGARETLGNPLLDRTSIMNLDARFELFPRVSEVLAVSVFHKRFEKPIETFIIPTDKGVLSYQNAKGATNTGVELEGRKGLDFIRPWLNELTLLANVTFVHSRVELDPAAQGIQTSQERPLAGQSPFVVNTALDWTHEKTKTRARILYNVQGRRIAEVGTRGVPDAYEQPRHIVDVSAAQGLGEHVDLKFTIENLFDSPVRFTQGESGDAPLVRAYSLGQTFWLLATYSN
jgi:hypothetical protein